MSEIYLEATLTEITQAGRDELIAAELDELSGAILEVLILAFTAGAVWAVLTALRCPLPRLAALRRPDHPQSHYRRLLERSKEQGYTVTLTDRAVRARLEFEALELARVLRTRRQEGGVLRVGAETRSAFYAARNAAQEGIAGVAERSGVTVDGQPVPTLKTWVRLAFRSEHRAHHDALEGVTIPYTEKFILRTPRGTFRVDRPYDPALPFSERAYCGHGIRLSLPRGARMEPWEGGDPMIPDASP